MAGGRLAMVILVIFSYPLQAHPCRASLDKVFQTTHKSHHPSAFKYFAMTTTILIASYIVAITVTKLDVVNNNNKDTRNLINLVQVLSFVGSTGSTTISFILPGLFYYKIHQNDPWRLGKVTSVILAIYGILIMAFCLTFNVLRVVNH